MLMHAHLDWILISVGDFEHYEWVCMGNDLSICYHFLWRSPHICTITINDKSYASLVAFADFRWIAKVFPTFGWDPVNYKTFLSLNFLLLTVYNSINYFIINFSFHPFFMQKYTCIQNIQIQMDRCTILFSTCLMIWQNQR